MKIAGKIVGNIGYIRAELTRADLTQADLTRGRVDPHSIYYHIYQVWGISETCAGFYTKLNVWGSLGLNFDYDGGPIIENGGPTFFI